MRDVLSAIDFLHSHGIFHRDIKAENLVYENASEMARLKLVDFGLAKRFEPDSPRYETEVVGTPNYIAPEVLLRSYSIEADLWSAGVVAFLMLSGRFPFEGTPEERNAKIIIGSYTFHDRYWGTVSDAAKDLVRGLLCVDEEQRLTASRGLRCAWLREHAKLDSWLVEPSTPIDSGSESDSESTCA